MLKNIYITIYIVNSMCLNIYIYIYTHTHTHILSSLASLLFNSHDILLYVYFTLLFSHTAPTYCTKPTIYSLYTTTPIDFTDFCAFS